MIRPTPNMITLIGDAAQALEDLSQKRTPDPLDVLAGAFVLAALKPDPPDTWDRDLTNAAGYLTRLATGETLILDATGRDRAAHLARRVRELSLNFSPRHVET